jgi:hypothetical protein
MRAYNAEGQYTQISGKTEIEMLPGGKGSWKGPLKCQSNGECYRIWSAPSMVEGKTTFRVTLNGVELKIRPTVYHVF